MRNQVDLRSLEVINFADFNHLPIHIIGMGATGSRVFEQLVCMGASNIHCYDFDEVEGHNLHNQLWRRDDVGYSKVMAAARWLYFKYSVAAEEDDNEPVIFDQEGAFKVHGYPGIYMHNERVTSDSVEQMTGIVFLLTDTFKSREDLMNGIVNGGRCPIVVETRLGTRFNEVRLVDPFDKGQVKAFMASLGDDDAPDAEVSACGTKINCALSAIGAANIACWAFVNFLTKQLPQQRINNNYQPLIQQGSQEL